MSEYGVRMSAFPSLARRPSAAPSRRNVLLGALALPALAACGLRFPADAAGTLDRAEGGRLRVGVSPHPPYTDVAEDGSVSGSEVDLIRSFCSSIGAVPSWRTGPEGVLAPSLHDGDLDVLIGGLEDSSPWKDEIALTRPYRTVRADDGEEHKLVMAVRPGENALQVALERHLAEQEGEL